LDQSTNIKHIAIDMQRLVAEQTAWHAPTVAAILPNVLKLALAFREHTLYARFIAPHDVEDAHGCWKAFYRRWPMITGKILDQSLLDLVAPLAKLARPDQLFDKLGYSIFSAPTLDSQLRQAKTETLILSGIETDVCVYSSALAAVDLGYFVVLAEDALASPNDQAHRSVLTQLAPRLPEQIKIMTTNAIIGTYAT
jgi:nicotinamidase-related amidase